MLSKPPFAIFCMITGFVIGALGVLVLLAQCAEWLSFGNWNPVPVMYAFDYFDIQLPHFISTASGIQKILYGFRAGFSHLPLSITLLGIGGLIAAMGGKHVQHRAKRLAKNQGR